MDSPQSSQIVPWEAEGVPAGSRCLGQPRLFLCGAGLRSKFALTFARPFELASLGVRNSGKPTASATKDRKAVPCAIKVLNKTEYEVQFTPRLHLDNSPVEIRIGPAS